MNQESAIIQLLRQEEGICYSPYIDSLGYPTVGIGFKLGPQGIPLSHYSFRLSDNTINVWLEDNLSALKLAMLGRNEINIAYNHCNQPRRDILISMAYQMGTAGLERFHDMLSAIIKEDWDVAAIQMLNSIWAKQTQERAHRHASVMRSGQWQPTYDL